MLRTNPNIRYEPQERCPPGLALVSALQIFVPNTISMVVLLTLIARASGHPDNNLGWIISMGMALCGASMIFQAFRFPYLGLGGLVVANFNVPFMAVSTLALAKGGPGLLASLLVASMLLQVVVTWRFASFRRIFTPTVSGTIVMLVAISAVPFIVENAFANLPPDVPVWHSLIPSTVALSAGILVSLRAPLAWRLWVLPITVAAGVAAAAPLGLYDVDLLLKARWVALPGMNWPGFDLTFGADFWTLLPAFLFINLTAFVKAVGDLSVIRRASYRTVGALDIKSIQGGLNVYGAGTLLSGLLGTLPVGSPWSISAVYIGFTGIASRNVGIFLGLLTIAAAPLFKIIAFLIAIPSPVVSAVYVILFGLLFIEGAKTVFDGSAVDNQKGRDYRRVPGVRHLLRRNGRRDWRNWRRPHQQRGERGRRCRHRDDGFRGVDRQLPPAPGAGRNGAGRLPLGGRYAARVRLAQLVDGRGRQPPAPGGRGNPVEPVVPGRRRGVSVR